MFISICVVFKMPYNGLQLAEGGVLVAQNCLPALSLLIAQLLNNPQLPRFWQGAVMGWFFCPIQCASQFYYVQSVLKTTLENYD
jgi:hypothetical protein